MLKKKIFIAFVLIMIIVLPQVASAAFNASVNDAGARGNFCLGGFCLGGSVGFGGGGGGWNIGNISGFGLPSGSISGIIQNILSWLLLIFGFLGIIGFVISGAMYLVAAGDEGLIDRAKTAMNYSLVGIVVGLMGLVIIQAINIALQGSGTF